MIAFASRYAALPEHFFARLAPAPVAEPRLIQFNEALARQLGLDTAGLDAAQLAAIFSGNLVPEGARPIAMAYAGHQFGQFVPQLGDGRAILLGEMQDEGGRWRDVQLKGSGRTPFSRTGDGRAALGPVLREYLVSEAMHALGIPATRALAAVSTGETVRREQRLPGAILTRVAASHVRVGTFQYFSARGDTTAVRRLADFCIDRLYPQLQSHQGPYLGLLAAVIDAQAQLVAQWMHVGFIHGVMNTDNMAISGETIDFGPCAFLDSYDPATVFSSIDGNGRYAYANQPHAALWNLTRFAETLVPCIDPAEDRAIELATAALREFPAKYSAYWLAGMRRKIGLLEPRDTDAALVQALLDEMQRQQADFTLTFRALCEAARDDVAAGSAGYREARARFADPKGFDQWALAWRERLAQQAATGATLAEAMRGVNPLYIPRNHLVEQVIRAATDRGDFEPFARLLQILAHPFEMQPGGEAYAEPPQPAERVLQTFCGT
ncbi:MAG: YdiU family protein [Steroidobacterales bacterium]